jgi:hypothetical protein
VERQQVHLFRGMKAVTVVITIILDIIGVILITIYIVDTVILLSILSLL